MVSREEHPMSNGNTLSLGQQANFIAEITKTLPRDINPDVSHDWKQNDKAFIPTSFASCSTHLIDLDADPFVPDGWTVEKHQKGGQFKWRTNNVSLHLDKSQKNGRVIEGSKLRKELERKLVLNANVLDYLLDHPHLIPEEWKSEFVFFWGTVYRNRDGYLFVRYFLWSDDRWHGSFYWLGMHWHDAEPALVVAS